MTIRKKVVLNALAKSLTILIMSVNFIYLYNLRQSLSGERLRKGRLHCVFLSSLLSTLTAACRCSRGASEAQLGSDSSGSISLGPPSRVAPEASAQAYDPCDAIPNQSKEVFERRQAHEESHCHPADPSLPTSRCIQTWHTRVVVVMRPWCLR